MLQLYIERDLTLTSLRGEVVSFTGDMAYMTREEAMNHVKAAGGNSPPRGALTKRTTVLVYGKANVGSKLDRARRDPTIEIISGEQFVDLLGMRGTVRRGEKISSRRETREWTKPANYDRPGRRTELDVIAGQGGEDRERRALEEGETRPSLSPGRRQPTRRSPAGSKTPSKSKPKRTSTPRSTSKPVTSSKPAPTTAPARQSTNDKVDSKVISKYFK